MLDNPAQQREETRTLRELLKSEDTWAIPGVYDALGAACAMAAGFPAVHVSGASIACSHGYPDIGIITLTEVLQVTSRICSTVKIPVIADAESGYGNAVGVLRTVREFEQHGAAGIHIEDQVVYKRCGELRGKRVESLDESILKIKAALAARRSTEFVIIARTDARQELGLDETIRRCQAFHEAGADCVFPEGLQSDDEVRAIGRAVPGPKILTMRHDGKVRQLPQEELQELGYRMLVFAVAPILASAQAMVSVMREIRARGTEGSMANHMISLNELYHILGLEELIAWDKRFS